MLLTACTRSLTPTTRTPILIFFDRLGNPIQYGDTYADDNEYDAGGLAGVEEYGNQEQKIPGVATPDQEEILGVTTPEEEEEIPEVEIPEEEYEETEIPGVDQDTEDTGVSNPTGANHAMPGNPPGPIPTNDNNMLKVETVDDESDTEEDKNENEETIQDEEGLEFQVNPPSPTERHVWEASQRHGLSPRRHRSLEHKYPSDHYTNLMVHVFTQLNLKQGLKQFGTEGIKATRSEMQKIMTRWCSIR